jgi:cupin fold WbuC family metalloprotein
MKIKKESNEVEYNQNKLFIVDKNWIKRIKKKAIKNISKKFRTCIHYSKKDLVQEMLIVHTKDTIVKAHKHKNKNESILVLEGIALVKVYDNQGNIKKIFKIGDYTTKYPFFYKMKKNTYHSFNFLTKFFIFKETTQGPFNKNETIFAKWDR